MGVSTAAPKCWIYQTVISWMKTAYRNTKTVWCLLGTFKN